MRFQKALMVFIYLLLAEIVLFFAVNLIPGNSVSPYVNVFFAVAMALTLIGFLASSRSQSSTSSLVYYYILWMISLVFIYLYLFHAAMIVSILNCYFLLAVLIALLLAILDSRRRSLIIKRIPDLEKLRLIRERAIMQQAADDKARQVDTLRQYYAKASILKDKYQRSSMDKLLSLAKAREEIARLEAEKEEADKRAREGMNYRWALGRRVGELAEKTQQVQEAEKKITELSRSNSNLHSALGKTLNKVQDAENLKARYDSTVKSVSNARKEIVELEKDNSTLKRTLGKVSSEAQRQESLKQKYAKTLKNIQKDKAELESLLVVSPDGSSVHRPNCIVVRNIPKESRKLIPNWQEARQGGYTGCKLCSPEKKNERIIRNDTKYRFVGSVGADKFHRPSCTVVGNISPKDRRLFKTYKQAVKTGYTPCRVCNPQQ